MQSDPEILHAEHSCDDNGILKGSWEIVEVYSFASALHIALHGPEDILIFPQAMREGSVCSLPTACNVKAQLIWVFRTQASTTLVGNVEGKDMECLYIPLQC